MPRRTTKRRTPTLPAALPMIPRPQPFSEIPYGVGDIAPASADRSFKVTNLPAPKQIKMPDNGPALKAIHSSIKQLLEITINTPPPDVTVKSPGKVLIGNKKPSEAIPVTL